MRTGCQAFPQIHDDILTSLVLLLFLGRLLLAAGYNFIFQAAKAGNLAYVKALLLQGQDPNVTDSTGQYTPLIASAFLAHIEVSRYYAQSHAVDTDCTPIVIVGWAARVEREQYYLYTTSLVLLNYALVRCCAVLYRTAMHGTCCKYQGNKKIPVLRTFEGHQAPDFRLNGGKD